MDKTIHFQPENKLPQKIFLNQLSEDFLLLDERRKKKPIMVVGTCVKINRSNDMISVFFLEDITKAHVIEIFADKLPLDYIINVGDRMKIKGFYSKNKYDENIIRGMKLSKINVTEEYLFYLEILVDDKRRKDKKFNEEETLRDSSQNVDKDYIGQNIGENTLKKKLFSYIFNEFLKNCSLYKDNKGFVTRDQLLNIEGVNILRNKIKDIKNFDSVFDQVMNYFGKINVMANFNDGYIFLLNFFEEYEEKFFIDLKDCLRAKKSDKFQMNILIRIANNAINNNNEFLLNKEIVIDFINRQIIKKKMYFIDERRDYMCLFEF